MTVDRTFSPTETPPVVLTFAATDPTSGAGLQADLLTLTSLGCHALSVVTGITVQDTAGVESIHPVDSELLIDQARAVLEDIPVAVFKIGLVSDIDNIAAIADIISDYPDAYVVLDPILTSDRGDELATEDTIEALRELLIPQSTIICPNSLEARRLVASDIDDPENLAECAQQLINLGAGYVLITGAHEYTGDVVNRLYDGTGLVREDAWQRLAGRFHGSGCTLSSAIAGYLAHGMEISEAVADAQEFTSYALSTAFQPGMGQYIPDRFFWSLTLGEDELS